VVISDEAQAAQPEDRSPLEDAEDGGERASAHAEVSRQQVLEALQVGVSLTPSKPVVYP
jgi:hypothetical protein